MHDPSETITLELYRGWRFCFQPGGVLSELALPLRELELAQAMFKQLPVLPDKAAALERDELVSSVHGTDTIEGGDLTEAEVEHLVLDPERALQTPSSLR